MLNSSYDLWLALRELGYLDENSSEHWWDQAGSFEVVVGAILTQQTKWEKVELSLKNLKEAGIESVKDFVDLDQMSLAELIKPSGFYNKKSQVLKNLTTAMYEEFGDFETFKSEVTREWLLSQKGLGQESVDSILCYACMRDVMVVDAYTNRILQAFGYEFDSYDELQEWMVSGIEQNYDKIIKCYDKNSNAFTIYSRLHGKIVQYAKENSKSREVLVDKIQELL